MSHSAQARKLCNELRRLWLEGSESDREAVSSEIAALTQRPAFSSLSERVLAEMQGTNG